MSNFTVKVGKKMCDLHIKVGRKMCFMYMAFLLTEA